MCILSENDLLVHVIIPIRIDGEDSRVLHQFLCELSTKKCTGAYLRLSNLEQEKRVSVLDLGVARDAELVSMNESVAVIQWGDLRTFTIDLASRDGRVVYVESKTNRAEARCKVGDVRKCAVDSQCLPGRKCYQGTCIEGE